MADLLCMPVVATSSPSAVLTSWCVEVGEAFAEGDVIALVETDKATVEVTAEGAGALVRTLVAEGAEVAVGDPIAVLGAPGEEVDEAAFPPAPTAQALSASGAPASSPATPIERPRESRGRVFASPLARRMAKEAGLTAETLRGTGPGGRILRRDVEEAVRRKQTEAAGGSVVDTPATAEVPAPAASAPPAAPDQPGPSPARAEPAAGARPIAPSQAAREPMPAADHELVPHTPLRRAIAERLTAGVRAAPTFSVRAECRADALLDLRERLVAETGARVSVTALLVRAVAVAHTLVPELNVVWTDDAVQRFSGVDVAVAVETDGGLLTPVLRSADRSSLARVAAELTDLTERARIGRLPAGAMAGGTITVSNLGMYGVQEFSAIINPPQAAILAVGAVRRSVIATEEGTIGVARTMRLELTVDHRPVDGATAGRWMTALTGVLESPLRILC